MTEQGGIITGAAEERTSFWAELLEKKPELTPLTGAGIVGIATAFGAKPVAEMIHWGETGENIVGGIGVVATTGLIFLAGRMGEQAAHKIHEHKDNL